MKPNNTKRYLAAAVAGFIGVAGLARAADNAPALPSGHPDITKVGPSTRPAGALPSGHPQLPSGHPDVNASKGQQAPTDGTLAIRVIPGTKDGPAVGGMPVKLDFYHRGKVVQKAELTLDNRGVVLVQNVPLLLQVQPVASVEYGGVTFRAVGEVMDENRPAQQINLPVYETTTERPAWTVKTRHVIVHPAVDGGVKVMEMLGIESPSDKAWLGEGATKEASGVTMTLPLPAGARKVESSAIEAGTAKFEGGRLVSTASLNPGSSQLQYSYVVPVSGDGTVVLSLTAPADTVKMGVFVPEQGMKADVSGLVADGSFEMGKGRTLVYKGEGLKAGHVATLTLKLTPRGAAAAPAPGGAGRPVNVAGGDAPQIIAGVGGGLVLAVGMGYLLFKQPAKGNVAAKVVRK
jgi:hypothetical protein